MTHILAVGGGQGTSQGGGGLRISCGRISRLFEYENTYVAVGGHIYSMYLSGSCAYPAGASAGVSSWATIDEISGTLVLEISGTIVLGASAGVSSWATTDEIRGTIY
jgi:hypothetical protein